MADIKLLINNKEIPLNPIMSVILTNVNLGFIKALKRIPEERKKVN